MIQSVDLEMGYTAAASFTVALAEPAFANLAISIKFPRLIMCV